MFRYSLEKYKGVGSKHTCPRCNTKNKFVRYVDNEKGGYLNINVGRCDREEKCGYHLKPRDFLKDKDFSYQPTTRMESPPPKPISYMDKSLVEESMNNYDRNNFVQFLYGNFDRVDVDSVIEKYRIGTSSKWNNSTVFWQIDKNHKVRTGKVMLYDKQTGKRVKGKRNYISWVHEQPYNLEQCFFGEHLITRNKKIGIVESEKTAIISSLFIDEYTWIASSGLGNLTPKKLEPLNYYNVTFFPDNDGYSKWESKAKKLGFNISDMLVGLGEEPGYDLADWILENLQQLQ